MQKRSEVPWGADLETGGAGEGRPALKKAALPWLGTMSARGFSLALTVSSLPQQDKYRKAQTMCNRASRHFSPILASAGGFSM